MKANDRERAIVAAYRRGDLIDDICAKHGVGRTTIYHILKRTGTTPSRTRASIEAQSRDETLAGLYELIQFQDKRIQELETALQRASSSSNGPSVRKPATG